MKIHKVILTVLILLGIIAVGYIIYFGYSYYDLSLTQRPYSDLHELLRPSGIYGHGYGILGSVMLLLLLVYSIRKRSKWFPKIGKLSTWLKYHMFLGVMGPALVTFHTSFKVGGIVAVSYWSMIIVMLSGFVGRYLYTKIPRSISGHELTLQEIEQQNHQLRVRLREEYSVSDALLEKIEELAKPHESKISDFKALFRFFWLDIKRPFALHQLYKKLKKDARVEKRELKNLKRLMRQKLSISRKVSALEITHKYFHNWHVFHKPFAYVMLFIMVIHIAVVTLFGYHWIF